MITDLVGIVLMGGKSSRMGTDKSQLLVSPSIYHDKKVPAANVVEGEKQQNGETSNNSLSSDTHAEKKQLVSPRDSASNKTLSKDKRRENVAMTLTELAHSKLKCYVNDVFYSINKNQENLGLNNTILDQYEGEGPLSGIISALNTTQQPIVVLGIDMPLITKQSIKNLVKHRNWDLLTTTYYDNATSKWEPMLSIWEFESLPCLEEYFDNGGRSIQKFLNQYGNQRVPITNKEEFANINTMEEYERFKET